jgi:hypothetical protein
MKSLKLLLLACTVALIAGCGGAAEVVDEGEALLSSSEALSTCTAACATGSVSCPVTATTCTATNGSGVTCDGTFYARPSAPTCSDWDLCRDIHLTECLDRGSVTSCCTDTGATTSCTCNRVWFCRSM